MARGCGVAGLIFLAGFAAACATPGPSAEGGASHPVVAAPAPADVQGGAVWDPCRIEPRQPLACHGEVRAVLSTTAAYTLCSEPERHLCMQQEPSTDGDLLSGAIEGGPSQSTVQRRINDALRSCERRGRARLGRVAGDLSLAIAPGNPGEHVVTLRGPDDPRWCAVASQVLATVRDGVPRAAQAADPDAPRR